VKLLQTNCGLNRACTERTWATTGAQRRSVGLNVISA